MNPENFYLAVLKDFLRKYWFVAAFLVLAVLTGFGSFLYMNNYFNNKPVPKKEAKLPILQPVPPVLQKLNNKTIVCQFDGAPLEELPSRRVLAMSIDNSPEARPQSGLKDADIIMELPVEGGITRFLAFYYHMDAVRVGPIRSARPYIIKKASEYGAVLIHAGKSPQADEYFIKTKAEHVDEIPATEGFWRENNRKEPHNLYTSTLNMWNYLNKNKITGLKNLAGFNFMADTILQNAQDSPKLTIFYPYGEVVYEYQPIDKDYLRFISGKAHIDAETYLPLRIKNIIIQFTKNQVLDGEGRLVVNLDGKGRAIIATGGKAIEGTWSKAPEGSTKYFDNFGKELVLPPGQTWIEIVQDKMQIDF